MATVEATTDKTSPGIPGPKPRNGLGTYLLLVGVQTTGAAIVLSRGVPIYRQIATDFSKHEREPGIIWWAVAAIALIQGAYWLRRRLDPPLPQSGHVALGHLASFVARLSFILASSTFAAMFFVRFDQLQLSPQRIVLVLVLLFSMFCYTLELERLARALNGKDSKL